MASHDPRGSTLGNHLRPFIPKAPTTIAPARYLWPSRRDAGLEQMMQRKHWIAAAMLSLGALVPLSAARADFEVTAPDGRRVLLKNDGTWTYVETAPAPVSDRPAFKGEGVLTLEHIIDHGNACKLGFRLQNDSNYEIRNIVPRFVLYRTNGIAYEARTLAFYSINPGNSLYRETFFRGIGCNEIGRVQVTGGDRCTIDDLDKFSYVGGACLDRVRVVPNDRLRFEK